MSEQQMPKTSDDITVDWLNEVLDDSITDGAKAVSMVSRSAAAMRYHTSCSPEVPKGPPLGGNRAASPTPGASPKTRRYRSARWGVPIT